MNNKYILITPARNEENYIEKTIISVVNQSLKPLKWIIIDDSSTDKTRDIIHSYQIKYPFIQLLSSSINRNRNFASKANAFNEAYKYVIKNELEHSYIGNLDADVFFNKDYFHRIIDEFNKDDKIGIVGGIICEKHNGSYKPLVYNLSSVAGATQIFRRECFEEIGARYVESGYGGIDAIAEAMVRLNNWKIRTLPDVYIYHQRKTGMAIHGILHTRFKEGIRSNIMGIIPIFMVAKSVYKIIEKPYFLGAIIMILGYVYSKICRHNCAIPVDFLDSFRKEQKKRIIIFIKIIIKNKSIPYINRDF